MVVSLTQLPEAEADSSLVVVVGACGVVESERELSSELRMCGLPSPDWEATVGAVLNHYPAGTSVAGIWLRVEQNEILDTLVTLLLKATMLQVS